MYMCTTLWLTVWWMWVLNPENTCIHFWFWIQFEGSPWLLFFIFICICFMFECIVSVVIYVRELNEKFVAVIQASECILHHCLQLKQELESTAASTSAQIASCQQLVYVSGFSCNLDNITGDCLYRWKTSVRFSGGYRCDF